MVLRPGTYIKHGTVHATFWTGVVVLGWYGALGVASGAIGAGLVFGGVPVEGASVIAGALVVGGCGVLAWLYPDGDLVAPGSLAAPIVAGLLCSAGAGAVGASGSEGAGLFMALSSFVAGLVCGGAARCHLIDGCRGRCIWCGYDLTGNVSGICPECGHKRSPHGGSSGGRAKRDEA